MSKSPYAVIASVLGIGVAVMTNTCGGILDLAQSLDRCATPNLCCSSITANPKFLKTTVGSINECVPIKISTLPSASPSKIGLRAAFLTDPVMISTLMSMSFSKSPIPSACWNASISVGAIIHAWQPLSIAKRAAISATMVLPLPTSP